jgi:hypothetical protein
MESQLSLCQNQAVLLENAMLYGRTLKDNVCDISTKALSFAEPRGKEVSSF